MDKSKRDVYRYHQDESQMDGYVSPLSKWQHEVPTLQRIVLGCPLTEEMKCGSPCYTSEQRNIVLLHTFKSYCASLFSKHVLLRDAKRIPVQQTKNVQVARQVRFTPVGESP